ncbi:MAG: hypothetical protein ACTMKV_07085, partial [Sphingomonas parapaucimobilis]
MTRTLGTVMASGTAGRAVPRGSGIPSSAATGVMAVGTGIVPLRGSKVTGLFAANGVMAVGTGIVPLRGSKVT